MDSAPSKPASRVAAELPTLPIALKILIAGGFGAGKTTLVGTMSETTPLTTEETLSQRGIGIDDLAGVQGKAATTVAMDFGRITFKDAYRLYLFGTPGQERFWFMWDELALGALGAVVLADTRRLADCFPAVDYFERHRIPFIVAVNVFDSAPRHDLGEVEDALRLNTEIPILLCDARDRESGKQALIRLVEHARERHRSMPDLAGTATSSALSGGS